MSGARFGGGRGVSSFRFGSTPGKARSTRKAENCSPSTLAKTQMRSAKPPLVIHIFSPFSTKLPSAWRTARVLAASASEPAPDSLRA